MYSVSFSTPSNVMEMKLDATKQNQNDVMLVRAVICHCLFPFALLELAFLFVLFLTESAS